MRLPEPAGIKVDVGHDRRLLCWSGPTVGPEEGPYYLFYFQLTTKLFLSIYSLDITCFSSVGFTIPQQQDFVKGRNNPVK